MKSNITGKATVIIDAPISRVWEALTEPKIIKQYFFGTNTVTSWEVGGPIKFTGEYEGKSYEDKGTVMAFEPPKLVRYSYWSSMSGIEDKPENYVIVTYKLCEEDNKGTKLTICQENIPDEKMKAHSEENWKRVLANLKNLVEGSVQVAAF
jgi:uncharacterized protein YndB with AHSA1/START domain